MRKVLMVALAAGMLLLAVPAHADPPTVEPPEETSSSFVVDFCGFDVFAEFDGKSGAIIFEPRADFVEDRRLFFDPGTTATLTNVDTGESITVDASGPATQTITATDDGGFIGIFKASGNWIHFHQVESEILWTSGYWTSTAVFDADFNLLSAEEDLSRARVVNICDVLS